MLCLAAITAIFGPASARGQDKIAPLHIHVGQQAPAFVLPSAEGGLVKLRRYRGHNVLIDFYRGYW